MKREHKSYISIALIIGFLGGFALGQLSFANNVEDVLVSLAQSEDSSFANLLVSNEDKEKAEKEKARKEAAKKAREAKYAGINVFQGSKTELPYLGEQDAPITITEYSDYQCPYCGSFYSKTLPSILNNYVKTGKVKFIFKDFPLSFHKHAITTAVAARCAGEQGAYWYMHDMLFQNQRVWSSQGPIDIQDTLTSYAEELELDTEEFSTCLNETRHLSLVQADLEEGSAAGVDGTPGFTINNETLVGAQPFSAFKELIEKLLTE